MKYSLAPSLIIDPQDQAIDWIKRMLSDEGDEKKEDEKDKHHPQPPNKKAPVVVINKERKYFEVTPQMHAYLVHIRENIGKDKYYSFYENNDL